MTDKTQHTKRLSPKEEEIMACFWREGRMFVREVVEKLPDPKPHFNTVSTFVRARNKGLVSTRANRQFTPLLSDCRCFGVSRPLVEGAYRQVFRSVLSRIRISACAGREGINRRTT